ncbi:bile acid:sodium symporter family protein [Bremerella cremea]|uniref:Bile acid:sodium symporter family protein n=1 Tax=Bremerella cremea TaxID=1031537 RepID=A0A368KQP5_9BACT|nr:bile acid:sodium symporter [Bremerella cremea]RCS49205.1 bile acid:sodium symporter family protein [Bremerella cremea]
MRSILRRHWFLAGLMVVVSVGFAFSEPLRELPNMAVLRNGIVVTVLFLMAFPLAFGDLHNAVRRPAASLLATGMNFGVLPLIAWALSLLAAGDFAIGINLIAAIPCTLASAAVWTRRAGGNDSAALVVTIVTNSLCFLVTPFWLLWTTGSEITITVWPDPTGKGLSLVDMVSKLFVLIVLPMALGQLARLIPKAGDWASRHKFSLSIIAQIGILAMVLLGCISCGLKLRSLPAAEMPTLFSFATMIVLVLTVHFSTLVMGAGIARRLRFSRPDEIAIAFSGSQKTLMIGLAIATEFYTASPLAILPMVAYHVGQLFLDTAVADHYLRKDRQANFSPGEKMP